MKTPKQKFVDMMGWGFILWLLGFAMGMMLFPFVPVERLGWFIMPVMTILTISIAYRRLRGSNEKMSYFVFVGIAWLAIAVVLDYVFLVKAFTAENYYDADIFMYYTFAFLIPMIVGWKFGRRGSD